MDRYSRAYRDPKSPLAPITPLSSQRSSFDFQDAPKSYRSSHSSSRSSTKSTSKSITKSSGTSSRRSRSSCDYETEDISCRQPSQYRSSSQLQRSSSSCRKSSPSQSYTQESKSMVKSGSSTQHKCQCQCAQRQQPRVGLCLAFVAYLEVPGISNSCPSCSRQLRSTSPVSKPGLSPRTDLMLERSGMSKYKDLFQREEIDYNVFCSLTKDDLGGLGIQNAQEQNILLKAVETALSFFN